MPTSTTRLMQRSGTEPSCPAATAATTRVSWVVMHLIMTTLMTTMSLVWGRCDGGRVTFLPGAVNRDGDVSYAAYDVSSPQHGYFRPNASRLEIQSVRIGYGAAQTVHLEPIRVTLVDHFGIPIWRGFRGRVYMSLTDFPELNSVGGPGRLSTRTTAEHVFPTRSLPVAPYHQTVVFDQLRLEPSCPAVGRYRFQFRATGTNQSITHGVVATFDIAVTPQAAPASVEFLRPPSRFSNAFAPLSQQPVLRIVDECNNTIVDPLAQGSVSVSITAVTPPPASTGLDDPPKLQGARAGVERGIASFTELQCVFAPSMAGSSYMLNFTYVPNIELMESLQQALTSSSELVDVPPYDIFERLSIHVLWPMQESNCNRTVLSPLTWRYPERFWATERNVTVAVRGGIFSEASIPQTRCLLGTNTVGTTLLVDECNINCTFLRDGASEGTQLLSVSLDMGATYSNASSVLFLGVDSGLRMRFDDPTTEQSNIIVLDPLGGTRVGNVTVYVTDAVGQDMLSFSKQQYTVTFTSATLSLGGSSTAIVYPGTGVTQFQNITLRGFPPPREYVFYMSAQDPSTGQVVYGSRTVTAAYARDLCVPPPIITSVSSALCKFNNASLLLTSCSAGEFHTLTVYGKYFGLSGSTMFVGSTPCVSTKHDAINLGSQLVAVCYVSANSTLTVITSTTQIFNTTKPALIVADPVTVLSVSGCPTTVYPSTGGCLTNGSTRITVLGTNFGRYNATVLLNHSFTNIVIRCTNVTHSTTDPTRVLSCSIPVALGYGLEVSVRNAESGQLGRPFTTHAAVSYAMSTGVLCKTDSDGYFCSQRGSCDLTRGSCNCISSSQTGFWTGAFCQSCITGYYGSACTKVCPACSATSTCDDGVSGTGICVCNYGWGGTLCNVACPGGSTAPCSNHGYCNTDLTCTCYNTAETGYWSGTTCASCALGWSGTGCNIACPRANNLVCNGHGSCIDGTCKCALNYCDSACNVSFTGCSGCVAGAYGKDCSKVCPGGLDNICFGNGFCGDGPFGNGLCSCYDGWGGVNCTVTCPHGPSNLCSGHGSCDVDTGVCTCSAGYTLSDCGTECPGGAANPCSGNGVCNVGNSTCTCVFGWSGRNCSVACPGGTTTPCNLHGTCVQASSSCECYQDPLDGYWSGAVCSSCSDSWYGSGCNQQCPYGNGVQCGGHGVCSAASVTCSCYQSSTTGFWSSANCSECSTGYYGPSCKSECPGTACNPCYGRGNCSQGVNGTGLCTCDAAVSLGYWSGVVCDACAENWFGDNCTSACPKGILNATCSGRGSCLDGRTGAGTCVCTGNYGGSTCSTCAVGYYGVGCASTCPGPVGQPCNSRGSCDNTENSTGACTCTAGYGGTACQLVCPSGPYGICNARGTCILASSGSEMACVNCSATSASGYWTGASCSACQPGYYGATCKTECPGGASTPCNNRGTCNDGYSGDGTCTCTTGYAGLSCEKTCVGGALLPCSAHGVCDAVTGECTCYSDNSSGYWVGSSCSSCDTMYASSTCTVRCPTAVAGTACSGHGTCFQGVCVYCESGYCGTYCLPSAACSSCPSGTYGPNCTDCPGGRTNPCSGQGTCLQGINGDGRCYCNYGFRGANCSTQCPGPIGVPCYGRGVCSNSGTCTCTANWAGSDCNTPCAGFDQRLANSTSCSSVGVCDKVDGSCVCNYGYGGSYCQITCPGTSAPCNGRGTCLSANGTCQCYTNSTTGYWSGASCSYCVSGYYGTCIKQCAHGVSDASFTKCVCDAYWSGEGCDVPCPGLLDGNVCYGHGTCSWGRDALGTCTCDTNWYDATCRTFCTKSGCDLTLINGQCNVDTGACECEFDNSGHWSYTTSANQTCEVCDSNYFGATCESLCACSRHGTCDRRTGSCSCFADAVRGHWGGTSCATCADGYIGVRCQNLNVAVSPLGTVAAVATVPALDVKVGIVCHDPLYDFVYIGTSPVSVISSSGSTLSTLQLGGLALACVYRSSRELYIVTFAATRIILNVIDRPSGSYLRSEYVPLVTTATTTAALSVISQPISLEDQSDDHFEYQRRDPGGQRASLHHRKLFQFEPTNATSINGAVLAASGMLQPFDGVSSDVVIIPYTSGALQYYQISSGSQVTVASGFSKITDASPLASTTSAGTPVFSIMGTTTFSNNNASIAHWELAVLARSIPSSASTSALPWLMGSFYDLYGSSIAAVCSSCVPHRLFPTASSEYAVAIFVSPSVGMYLVSMRMPPIGNNSAAYYNLTMQYFYGSACSVTATTVDTYANNGYFAMTCDSNPSVIMKFRLDTCLVTGMIALSQLGTDVETVVGFYIDQTTRTLEALTPLSRSQRLQKVSLYAVQSLTPLIADTKGGTRITVAGEGFVSGMQCVFNSETYVAGSYVDSNTIVCIAPAGGTVSCSGEVVEIAVGSSGTTNNGELLLRSASASIRQLINAVTNSSTGFLMGSNVTVLGSGFVLPSNASLLLCKLYSPNGGDEVIVIATFVSSYEVHCSLPSVSEPLPKPSYLEVSIDGSVFSESQVEFDVLGDPSALYISYPASQGFSLQASAEATLPSVYVNIADAVEHPLGVYSDGVHTITAALSAGSNFLITGSLVVNTTAGLAIFSNISLIDPKVGDITIVFNNADRNWSTTLHFTVVEGEPYRMYFARAASSSVTNDSPTLSEQPIVGILDSSGNALSSLESKSIQLDTITLDYSYHDLNDNMVHRTVAVSQLNAQFRVEGVSITGIHQHAYYLTFSAPSLSESTLVSDPIVVGWCPTTEFAVENSTACEGCPSNGVCDGTFAIQAEDNWWRADNTTLQFYSCAAPYSGDSCFNNSQCMPGYRGVRCSLCEAGYGRSGRKCIKCQTSSTNTVVVALACVALLVVIVSVIFSIVMTSAQDILPVLLRNLVTYIQILARLSDTRMAWPAVLDTLWTTISSIANLQAIDFSPFDCAMQTDFFHKYVYTLIIPWAMIVAVAPLTIAIVRWYATEEEKTVEALNIAASCREEEDHSILKEIKLATAQRRATMIGEISRRQQANPLAVDGDANPEGLEGVLDDDMLSKLAEREAVDRTGDWSVQSLVRNRIEHVKNILTVRRARYRPMSVLVVTAVTIFTLLYPTLVQSSGQVLQCEEIDMGAEGIQRLSSNQRDVSCDSAYYMTFYTLSVSMIMVYGVSIPLGLIAVVEVLKRIGGIALARAVLAFTMSGFKPELWFWESVNMGRKFMAMFVVVFVTDAKLQMIVFMWVVVIGFVLNVTFAPYTSHVAYVLESLGLAATCVTMNLVLMFFLFSNGSSGGYDDWRAVLISVFVIIINATVAGAYMYAIVKHGILRYQKWRDVADEAKSLEELAVKRVQNMHDYVDEIRGLRVRRAELDLAIEKIETRLDEVSEKTPPINHLSLEQWQFPTDAFRLGGSESKDDSEAAAAQDDDNGDKVQSPASPTLNGGKRTLVSFTGEEETIDGADTEAAAAGRSRLGRLRALRRGAAAVASSHKPALHDFDGSVVGTDALTIGTDDLDGRPSHAPALALWVDEDFLDDTSLLTGPQKFAALTAARDNATGRSASELPLFTFTTEALLDALGGDIADSPEASPQLQRYAFPVEGGDEGEEGECEDDGGAFFNLHRRKSKRKKAEAEGLSMAMLRRLNSDEPMLCDPQGALFAMDDDLQPTMDGLLLRRRVYADEDPMATFHQPDARVLLEDSDENSQADGAVAKRLRPVDHRVVTERVTSWYDHVASSEAQPLPADESFSFDHHYRGDEEAEVDFLEGRRPDPPPPERAIFSQPRAEPFDARRDIELLDEIIAEDASGVVLAVDSVSVFQVASSTDSDEMDGSHPRGQHRRSSSAWVEASPVPLAPRQQRSSVSQRGAHMSSTPLLALSSPVPLPPSRAWGPGDPSPPPKMPTADAPLPQGTLKRSSSHSQHQSHIMLPPLAARVMDVIHSVDDVILPATTAITTGTSYQTRRAPFDLSPLPPLSSTKPSRAKQKSTLMKGALQIFGGLGNDDDVDLEDSDDDDVQQQGGLGFRPVPSALTDFSALMPPLTFAMDTDPGYPSGPFAASSLFPVTSSQPSRRTGLGGLGVLTRSNDDGRRKAKGGGGGPTTVNDSSVGVDLSLDFAAALADDDFRSPRAAAAHHVTSMQRALSLVNKSPLSVPGDVATATAARGDDEASTPLPVDFHLPLAATETAIDPQGGAISAEGSMARSVSVSKRGGTVTFTKEEDGPKVAEPAPLSGFGRPLGEYRAWQLESSGGGSGPPRLAGEGSTTWSLMHQRTSDSTGDDVVGVFGRGQLTSSQIESAVNHIFGDAPMMPPQRRAKDHVLSIRSDDDSRTSDRQPTSTDSRSGEQTVEVDLGYEEVDDMDEFVTAGARWAADAAEYADAEHAVVTGSSYLLQPAYGVEKKTQRIVLLNPAQLASVAPTGPQDDFGGVSLPAASASSRQPSKGKLLTSERRDASVVSPTFLSDVLHTEDDAVREMVDEALPRFDATTSEQKPSTTAPSSSTLASQRSRVHVRSVADFLGAWAPDTDTWMRDDTPTPAGPTLRIEEPWHLKKSGASTTTASVSRSTSDGAKAWSRVAGSFLGRDRTLIGASTPKREVSTAVAVAEPSTAVRRDRKRTVGFGRFAVTPPTAPDATPSLGSRRGSQLLSAPTSIFSPTTSPLSSVLSPISSQQRPRRMEPLMVDLEDMEEGS